MIKLQHSIALYILLGLLVNAKAQSSWVQFAHCSADTLLKQVDIWIDSSLVADNLAFRNATAFLETPSNTTIQIRITHFASDSITFAQLDLNVQPASQILARITGFVTAGYTPFDSLSVDIIENVKSQSNMNGNSDIMIINDVSDLSAVRISENKVLDSIIIEGLHSGSHSEYFGLESLHYRLHLDDSINNLAIREYDLKLAQLGLENKAIIVDINGFKSPVENLNGAEIGAFIIPVSGGSFISLTESYALIQVVNNSADPTLAFADFYKGSSLILENLGFRHSSGYFSTLSGKSIVFAVAPGNSGSAADSISTTSMIFEAEKSYVIVLNGLHNEEITPFVPLSWLKFEAHGQSALGYNTDIAFIHGSHNTGLINLMETSVFNQNLFKDILYDSIADYITIPSANYSVKLFEDNSMSASLTYLAHIEKEEMRGKAIIWLLSGFSDSLLTDSTRTLGIYVIQANGGKLKELEKVSGIENTNQSIFKVYPNPTSNEISWKNLIDVNHLTITNSLGRFIEEFENPVPPVDLSFLSAGIYSLKFETIEGISVQRVSIIGN